MMDRPSNYSDPNENQNCEVNSLPLFHIDRIATLEFYDTRPIDSRKHASAINAVAGEDLGAGLMKHYLEYVTGAVVTILDETCTPGKREGKRLDRIGRAHV